MGEGFIKYILGEFRTIVAARGSFAIAAVGVALVIWLVLDWRYAGIISNKDSEITIIKAQRDDYRDKLGGSSPDQAKARIDELEQQLIARQTEPRHLKL